MTTRVWKDSLDKRVTGIVDLIHRAECARHLAETIGTNAEPLTQEGFANLFGTLQNMSIEQMNLALVTLFERPGRYQIHGIPGCLDLMEEGKTEFAGAIGKNIADELEQFGESSNDLLQLKDQQLTERIVGVFRRTMPDPARRDTDELSKALYSLKTFRDKRIAHAEIIAGDDLPEQLWGYSEDLLKYAKTFTTVVGPVFLSVTFLHHPAQSPAHSLQRLIQQAGIVSDPNAQGSSESDM